MDKKNSLVVQYKNELNRASMKLDVPEARILMTAIAQAPKNNIRDDEFYYVDAESLMKLGTLSNHAYRDMKKAAETLFDRHITLSEEDAQKNKSVRKFRWIQAVSYQENEGRIGIQFSNAILPFLQMLKSEFTSFHLNDLRGLNSAYAIRIYQLLMQFKSTGVYVAKVDDLKEQLSVGDKFKLYGDFKRRVIDLGIKQINENPNTSIRVTYKEKKIGRRVDSITFYFEPKLKTPKDVEVIDVTPEVKKVALTEKQAAYFASLLCTEETSIGKQFVSKFGKGFLSYEDMKNSIAQKLQDAENYETYREWLLKVGFEE